MKNLLRLCVFYLGTRISLDFTTSVVHFIRRLHLLQNGITQMKIPVPESSEALVQPIFMLLFSISRIKCKEFSYFQGNKLSKLFQEKIFSYTQNNREQVFTRNVRHTCISFKCLKDRKKPHKILC